MAALFAPGGPGVSRISASARHVSAWLRRQCAAATAQRTTTSASCECPPACRRGELMWRGPAAATKVGENGLGKWRNYANQLAIGNGAIIFIK